MFHCAQELKQIHTEALMVATDWKNFRAIGAFARKCSQYCYITKNAAGTHNHPLTVRSDGINVKAEMMCIH